MKKILVIGATLMALSSQAQKVIPCLSDEVYVESVKQFPEIKLEENRATAIAAAPVLQKKGTVKYIPVVFHVIHKNGLENISITQLNDALRVMNEDLRKLSGTNGGSSTDPLATDMEYEFRLAQFDPNGLPTNGVNRIYNVGTDNARDAQKAISYWDARKYFNVWVVNTISNSSGDPNSIVLGYAQFPFQLNSQTSTDGIMARADQFGAIELADASQAGRTLTHEAGHWLGLYHPFQGGCVGGTSTSCLSYGDQVCDTPPVSTATTGCPSSRNSCTNDSPDKPDLIKNYMDYADGNCMNMFTVGQKTRVDQIMNTYRANIYSSTNLSAAGLNADGSYKTLTASATKAPYTFGFDVSSLAGTGWVLENYMSPGDSGWQVGSTGPLSGTGCMVSQNLKNTRLNVRNAFLSPNIDITTLSSPSLTFYMAYARRSTVSGDRIRVFISNSYGRSEILLRTILATELATGTTSTSAFVPTSAEWKKYTIDLTPYKAYTNCKIRIELQSLRGNNIYFDQFSIAEPTGISERLKQEMNFSVFPNPAKDLVSISFENKQVGEVEMELFDLQGKLVQPVSKERYEAGLNQINMDLKGLQSGVYLLKVQTDNGSFVHKLWVE